MFSLRGEEKLIIKTTKPLEMNYKREFINTKSLGVGHAREVGGKGESNNQTQARKYHKSS